MSTLLLNLRILQPLVCRSLCDSTPPEYATSVFPPCSPTTVPTRQRCPNLTCTFEPYPSHSVACNGNLSLCSILALFLLPCTHTNLSAGAFISSTDSPNSGIACHSSTPSSRYRMYAPGVPFSSGHDSSVTFPACHIPCLPLLCLSVSVWLRPERGF